jgi:glutathione S-transferase
MIKIYNFPRGARGLRVMWQCEEMGLPYKFEPVTFPPSEAYRALNPLGSVPFLEDEGGVAINESVAMTLYLAQKYGPTPLLPTKDAKAMAGVLQLTVLSEATLGGQMNPLMLAHFAAPEGEKRNWLVNSVEGRVEQALALVEAKLGDRQFLVGEDLTLADICIATALGMWKGALNKTPSPRLAAFQDRMSARPAYQKARQAMTPS